MKQHFLSCDWGTSSFRLRLVDAGTLTVLAVWTTDDGILKTYTTWKQQGLPEQMRIGFYRSVMMSGINELQTQVHNPLNELPVIVSGMASANIGMMELPYKELPVLADGSNLYTKKIAADPGFPYNILLVSGIRTMDDVMRGEEVQLAGVVRGDRTERIFVFPGTHSKHVRVKDGEVQEITTYMTGEFFELLSQKSILAGSVEYDPGIAEQLKTDAFRKGVEAGMNHSLLHTGFKVRTNQLFGHLSKTENYYYLSGLITGAEMKELSGSTVPVTIVADTHKQACYMMAAEMSGSYETGCEDMDKALVAGHAALYRFHACS